jgi:predicted ATPase
LFCSPRHRDGATAPEDPYVSGLIYLFWTLLCLGYGDRARLRRDEALDEARRLSPHTLAFALCLVWIGDWAIEGVKAAPEMLQSAEEVLAVSTEQGFPQWPGVGKIMNGWCLAATGQAAGGISSFLQGLEIFGPTVANLGSSIFSHHIRGNLRHSWTAGRRLSRLPEAAKLVETQQERWAEAEIHRLRGTLLLALHKEAQAEESYCRAIAVAQEQSAKFWELRAATALARLWRDQGKRTEPRDLLVPIYCWFTEGFDTPVLRDAKAPLDQLR